MENPVLEYIKLLDRRPDVIAKILLEHVKTYKLSDEEQLGIVELWLKNPQLAESLFSAYCEQNSLGEATLLRLLELWKNGSDSAGCFLQKYGAKWSLGTKVETELVKSDFFEVESFLLSYSKKHIFCEDAQVALVELIPNSLAIVLLKAQRSYAKSTLLKMLDIWTQYPEVVSGIIFSDKCLESIFEKKDVLLKVLDFIEEKPDEVSKIVLAYQQYNGREYPIFIEIMEKLLNYIEKGSESAKKLFASCSECLSFYGDICEKIMVIFKEKPADMYSIVSSVVKKDHDDCMDTELIKLWQGGSKEAYNLLMVSYCIDPGDTAKVFALWQQGVPGAYEILKAQDINLLLGNNVQIKLVDLLGKGSEEAYNLLFAHTHYPGHKLCPEALMKLALIETPEADTIIKRTINEH